VDSTTAELVAVVDGFEATLSLLNRSPLSRNVEVPSGEKLAELSDALVQVNEQIGQLKTATISGVDTQAAAARFAEVRQSIQTPIENAQEATSKLKVVLADSSAVAQEVNAAFPQWMDWFTWGSTFMFSWLAIGQVALLRASWRWARGE
jgi:hypothetical protein